MVLTPAIQRLLDQLPQSTELDFHQLLESIYRTRFTGPLTVDFLNGQPRQISLGQPVKLSICTPVRNGALDKPPSSESG